MAYNIIVVVGSIIYGIGLGLLFSHEGGIAIGVTVVGLMVQMFGVFSDYTGEKNGKHKK